MDDWRWKIKLTPLGRCQTIFNFQSSILNLLLIPRGSQGDDSWPRRSSRSIAIRGRVPKGTRSFRLSFPPAISPYLRHGCMAGYPYPMPNGIFLPSCRKPHNVFSFRTMVFLHFPCTVRRKCVYLRSVWERKPRPSCISWLFRTYRKDLRNLFGIVRFMKQRERPLTRVFPSYMQKLCTRLSGVVAFL